jgi:osmoprotectant transport system ATP-binding protein
MIEFDCVSKTLSGQRVVDGLSLLIARGEFAVLMGPSGAGKSSCLKMINRLLEHDEGRILFAGEPVRSLEPEALRRRIGYAIQSIGLFPHWTVAQNSPPCRNC